MFNLISTNEKNFITKRLNAEPNPIREDKRESFSYRNISIRKLHSNGQIEVKIGNTLVISQIFAKLTSPYVDRPSEGIITFSVDTYHIKPNADYNQSNEALNEFRTKISNLLEKSLRESKALDTNSLCISPGKLVWKIVIDINIINNDGNAIDACFIATLASWLSYKIPFLRKKNDKVICNGQTIHLTMLHMPFCVTFGLFNTNDNKMKYLCDPSWKEEQVMKGFLSVSANIFGEICYLQMTSSVQVSTDEMNDILLCASDKIKELHKQLKLFLEIDKKNLFKASVNDDVEMNEQENYEGCKFMEKINSAISIRKHYDLLSYELPNHGPS